MKQRPRKIVKSKAVVEDKEDEVEIVLGPVDIDYTMGGCDGPNVASGADTVRFLTILRTEPRFNIAYRFAQMAVDNIFGDEETKEIATPSKDKGKKRTSPASKVRTFRP